MSVKEGSIIPELRIRQIEIRTHAHATESIEKVVDIFKNLVVDEKIKDQIKFDNLTGTFGQRITDLHLILKKSKQINSFIDRLSNELNESDKFMLCKDFSRRLDNKLKYYLRIDKHSAALGKLQLSKHPNSIQIVIANFNKTPTIKADIDHLINYYQQLQIINCER